MTEAGVDVDPIWEDIYSEGQQLNKYPFNNVPNFFFRYVPKDKPRNEVTVMEVGFGAGNNLWLCAREGTAVCGVDAAPSGVEFARNRFAAEGLSGDLTVGDFCELPYKDNSIDMVINRQALTQVSHSRSKRAVREIHRCLRVGGHFWSNMFSDLTHRQGDYLGDGLWDNIRDGVLTGVGQTAFHSISDIKAMYGKGWKIVELVHQQNTIYDQGDELLYCEWLVVTEKIG